MTIDEAIEKNRKFCCMNCDKFSCKECKETRNQISDLLEELKAYRANEGISENVYRLGYKFGYNKAIDDFAGKLKTEYKNALSIPAIEKETAYFAINKVAEQLKADHPVKESED